MKLIEESFQLDCVWCHKDIDAVSLQSPVPDVPDMIGVPSGTWTTVLLEDDKTFMVGCCSRACVEAFMTATPEERAARRETIEDFIEAERTAN